MPGGLGGFSPNFFVAVMTVLFAGAGFVMSGLMSLYHLLRGDGAGAKWWALVGVGLVVASIGFAVLVSR